MSPRTRPARRTDATARTGQPAPAAGDALLNQQMAEALLQGADARAARDAAASREEQLSNERLRATLQALVAGRGAGAR